LFKVAQAPNLPSARIPLNQKEPVLPRVSVVPPGTYRLDKRGSLVTVQSLDRGLARPLGSSGESGKGKEVVELVLFEIRVG